MQPHFVPCRILLVEDDDCSRLVFVRALTRTSGARGTVHYVESEESEVKYLEGTLRRGRATPVSDHADHRSQHDARRGFVVLELPQLNPGWSVVPKIVFTSSDDPDDVATAYLLGASAYYQKSCAAAELVACVECLLGYWLTYVVPTTDRAGRLIPRPPRKARRTLPAARCELEDADATAQPRREEHAQGNASLADLSRRWRQQLIVQSNSRPVEGENLRVAIF